MPTKKITIKERLFETCLLNLKHDIKLHFFFYWMHSYFIPSNYIKKK
jgi:hypothetical protein